MDLLILANKNASEPCIRLLSACAQMVVIAHLPTDDKNRTAAFANAVEVYKRVTKGGDFFLCISRHFEIPSWVKRVYTDVLKRLWSFHTASVPISFLDKARFELSQSR